MIRSAGLRQQLTAGILAYLVVLSLVVAAHGFIVNERAEQLVWESLLKSELDHLLERRAADPEYAWVDTETLKLYGPGGSAPPAELAALPAGVHDEIRVGKQQVVALVSKVGDDTVALALDISHFEGAERALTLTMLASTAVVVAFLALLTHLGAGWLARPLTAMANAISSWAPDHSGQRVVLEGSAPREAKVIATALNDYLGRLEQFVERERAFVNIASHELRTPIAVMAASAEVTLDCGVQPPAAEANVKDILSTVRDMERLVALLLALAKDPERLHAAAEPVDLATLVPTIVADHAFLAASKELEIEVDATQSSRVRAPVQIVRAAIGNLVRNAIENSERGVIRVTTAAPAAVTITDPGHGMSHEELSAIYTRRVRSGEIGASGGIGLDLIKRLCEHLGWQLSFSSSPGRGTTAVLDFAAAGLP
jgi:signal transduction histidine kinase